MMVFKNGTISSDTCNTHYCSTNDSFNPEGGGEQHYKKRKQTENFHHDSQNSFCAPTFCTSIAPEQQNSKSPYITTVCQQHHQSKKDESNYSNYSTTERGGSKEQRNVEVDDNQQQQHHHHPNCCLNLRESCVDSPCVSIQQPVLGGSTTSTHQKHIESDTSGIIGSTNSATVVTIGLDGNTRFNVHSKKLIDEREKSFVSSELRTFKASKSEQSSNINKHSINEHESKTAVDPKSNNADVVDES